MDRRSFLTAPAAALSAPPQPPTDPKNKYANKRLPDFKSGQPGTETYTGPWGVFQAKHLLNRTMFGFTKAQLDQVAGMSMDNAVNMILTAYPNQSPPVNNYYNDIADASCPPGVTWVDKGFNTNTNTRRIQSFKDWWLHLIVTQPLSIHEKMVLFWHNLFATQSYAINHAQIVYRHNQLLRTHAMGNYRTLAKEVSIDPAMLVYLNGLKNQKNAPDENYARELQELFTVGKGPNSLYTEDDVKAAARVLTGYQVNPTTETYFFTPSRHDTGNKQFSAFYNNTVITGKAGAAGEQELDELLDMIFLQQETSKNIVRELYRWFVYYVIDAEIEEKVITPLAEVFRTSNYEIRPVLEVLLKSAHFYDDYNVGCFIKNPIDFTAGALKNFNVALPPESNVADLYTSMRSINNYNALIGMDPGDPPNVAGWEAYWNAPIFHEFWINSVTLPYRDLLSEVLISPNGYKFQGVTLKADVMAYTLAIPNAGDPNELIRWLVEKFFAHGASQATLDALKAILLSNQAQDHYWTDAWNNYLSDPANMTYYNTVFFRLYPFYKYMLHLAEYHLI
jgi:uncharacterized protein (DUF1800 family)